MLQPIMSPSSLAFQAQSLSAAFVIWRELCLLLCRYSAPITAGNFVVNVLDGVYDGKDIGVDYSSAYIGRGSSTGGAEHHCSPEAFAGLLDLKEGRSPFHIDQGSFSVEAEVGTGTGYACWQPCGERHISANVSRGSSPHHLPKLSIMSMRVHGLSSKHQQEAFPYESWRTDLGPLCWHGALLCPGDQTRPPVRSQEVRRQRMLAAHHL